VAEPRSDRSDVVARSDRRRRRPVPEIMEPPLPLEADRIPSTAPPCRDSIGADRSAPVGEHPGPEHAGVLARRVERRKRRGGESSAASVAASSVTTRRFPVFVGSSRSCGLPTASGLRSRMTAMLESIVSRDPRRSSQRSAASSDRRAPVTQVSRSATTAAGSSSRRSTSPWTDSSTLRTSDSLSAPLGGLLRLPSGAAEAGLWWSHPHLTARPTAALSTKC
jgi:hypothetical protein